MAWFAFGEPGQSCLQSFRSSFIAFCFREPLDVFFLVAVREVFKGFLRLLILTQSRAEKIRYDQWRLFLRFRTGGHLCASVVQPNGFLDVAEEFPVRGQSGER